MSLWKNVPYRTASGVVPVRRFMEVVRRQDKPSWIRIMNRLDHLEDHDGRLDHPYNVKVEGEEILWELRIPRDVQAFEAGETVPRILYGRLADERKHVLFHAYRAGGPKVPEGELGVAKRLVDEHNSGRSR